MYTVHCFLARPFRADSMTQANRWAEIKAKRAAYFCCLQLRPLLLSELPVAVRQGVWQNLLQP